MAMNSGIGLQGVSSEINVTPLIDVLLVLLIVFMVIVPMAPKGLATELPQPSKDDQVYQSNTIVVSLLQGDHAALQYTINREPVSKQELSARLTEIYSKRAERVMFLKSDDDVNFAQVAEVIDIGHAAGVDHVGLMTPKVVSGN